MQVRANRVDVGFVDKENKEVILIEMSCPWMDNRKQNEEEVRAFATRAQETAPRVQDSTVHHRHRRSWWLLKDSEGRSQDVSGLR